MMVLEYELPYSDKRIDCLIFGMGVNKEENVVVIELNQEDKIIYVGMDEKTHCTEQQDGTFPYPNQDYILNQFGKVKILRVGGFHMWDCVEKLAKRAYERGIDVLVDEDLTEFFVSRLRDSDFAVDKYPTYNPSKNNGWALESFMKAREGRPWLWQQS